MSVLQGNLCKLFNVYKPVVNFRFSSKNVSLSSVESKLGLKPKPKKPATAFFRFTSKIKPNLLQQNPKATPIELVKLAAAEWKKADITVKNQLQEEYKVEWTKYKEVCQEYDQMLSPGDREEIKQALKEAAKIKEKRKLKKKSEELGRPKRPPTPFVMFMVSKSSERGDTPFREWQAKVGKMWEQLSEEEKAKLTLQHKNEMDLFRVKMEEWKKKMIAEGNEDLRVVSAVGGNNTEHFPVVERSSVSNFEKTKPKGDGEIKNGSESTLNNTCNVYNKESERLLKNSRIYRLVTIILVLCSVLSILIWLMMILAMSV